LSRRPSGAVSTISPASSRTSVTLGGDLEPIDSGGARLLSRMTRKSWEELGFAEGQNVYAQVKYVALGAGRGEPEE